MLNEDKRKSEAKLDIFSAARGARLRRIKLLFEQKHSNINTKAYKGKTAFFVSYLIEHGCDINAKLIDGYPALDLARNKKKNNLFLF